MNSFEIKEIFSGQAEEYRTFLALAIQKDEESLLITARDLSNAAFPTKDREDSFTLGAYVENVLAGIVSFSREGEDREKLRHKGFLSTMCVSMNFRGQGIAGKLLEETIRRVRALGNVEQINLIVIATNIRARQLYEKFGFQKFGTEENSIKWKDKYFAEDQMVLRLK